MMNLSARIEAFSKLGNEINSDLKALKKDNLPPFLQRAMVENRWFTYDSVKKALHSLATWLNKETLSNWTAKYNMSEKPPKTIGLVMAGNIPLVGFHDILCVLISGNSAKLKLSSKDQALYNYILEKLFKVAPEFKKYVNISEKGLKNIDAIVATGSNNSARYFEYYFGKYPNIIRKNRNSVGILSGNETADDFKSLGDDIFSYFGLGCRNVSFLLVPQNFNFEPLIEGLKSFDQIINHSKYANNYDYQKTIHLMNNSPVIDGGFYLFKQDASLASPIGVIHFIPYQNIEQVEGFIKQNNEKIQCIVSKTKWSFNTYAFGEAQQPKITDYADNVDTLKFLINS